MALKKRVRWFEATFTSGLLATRPMNEQLRPFTKGPNEDGVIPNEEVEADERAAEEIGEEAVDKGVTAFARDEQGRPCVWAYMIRGFLKSAMTHIRRDKDTECAKIKQHKQIINGDVFVQPAGLIPLELPEGGQLTWCQRPLRAQTMQGDRVAIATSEEAPPGTKIRFALEAIIPGLDPAIDECWELAEYTFLGQWRNSGKGTAIVREIPAPENNG